MDLTFDKCVLTGQVLKPENKKQSVDGSIEYETHNVGKVKITIPAYHVLLNNEVKEKPLIAGICKDRTIRDLEPILITSDFISEGYKKLNPPIDFEEKCSHFLKYLYQNGGRENKEFQFYSSGDFALAFADKNEFERIFDQMVQDNYIHIRTTRNLANRSKFYMGVTVTNFGRDEAKKELPKMPLFGLVSQEISTGDYEIDKSINHAREIFFDEPQTMDKMRSACETLSFVLEPLRNNLSTFLASRDVSDFFLIVNTFDIRHNKETTKKLVYPEQLEWVFYTLLNSINTYVKLKNKNL